MALIKQRQAELRELSGRRQQVRVLRAAQSRKPRKPRYSGTSDDGRGTMRGRSARGSTPARTHT
jgi:hypothetical protein